MWKSTRKPMDQDYISEQLDKAVQTLVSGDLSIMERLRFARDMRIFPLGPPVVFPDDLAAEFSRIQAALKEDNLSTLSIKECSDLALRIYWLREHFEEGLRPPLETTLR